MAVDKMHLKFFSFCIVLGLLGILPGCVLPGGDERGIAFPRSGAVFNGGRDIGFAARLPGDEPDSYTVKWDFGDNATAAGPAVTHAYDRKGSYMVTCTIIDQYEESISDTITLHINSSRYRKLDSLGAELPDDATDWTMVYDATTDLVWEVKQHKDGAPDYANPHDADNTYTWYDGNENTNGGDAGTEGEGTDTEDFISELNTEEYGGFSSWRLPDCDELETLLGSGRYNPAINTDFFPNTVAWYYWSGTTYVDFTYAACHIYFMGSPASGTVQSRIIALNHYGMKYLEYHARAVCPGQ